VKLPSLIWLSEWSVCTERNAAVLGYNFKSLFSIIHYFSTSRLLLVEGNIKYLIILTRLNILIKYFIEKKNFVDKFLDNSKIGSYPFPAFWPCCANQLNTQIYPPYANELHLLLKRAPHVSSQTE
jgi:hypothetical protein